MIFAKATKYGAGITVYGDYHDLTNLQETIYDLTTNTSHGAETEEFVLGLAYETRHAHQGDREVVKFPRDFTGNETDTYFAFKEVWPVFLMQLGVLRWLAGFQPTSKNHHANLFRLEACAEEALTSYDPFVGKRCVQWLTLFPGLTSTYLFQYVQNCCLQYVSRKETGKARYKELPEILRMLLPLSDEYREFEEYLEATAKAKGCRPAELRDAGDPWPEFKW